MTDDYKGIRTVTWLHLSDLHLCNPKTGWESEKILKKLQEDFKKLQAEEGLIPDMIFFTGDVVFGHLGNEKGKQIVEQYEDAAQFFDNIRASFSPEIPKERVFIVPGNHDVNRNKTNRYLHQGFDSQMTGDYHNIEKKLNNLINDTDKDDWKGFIRSLKEYRQFLEFKGYKHLLKDRDRLIYAVETEINHVKVGIAGFNSAWSSWQDNEKGKLWMAGHWQIQNLSNRLTSSQLKIALMHHPFNWFNPVEEPTILHEMSNNFDFFLHGHEHLGWVEEIAGGDKRISAGACYGDSEEEMGYNLTRLTLDRDGNFTGKVWLRKYDRTGEGWVKRPVHGKAEDGVWFIRKGLEPPAPKEQEAVEDAHEANEAPVAPIIEFPVDSPESRGVFGRENEINKIAKMVNDVPITFIYGLTGIGKTMLIDEVRRHPVLKERKYFRYPISQGMGLEQLFALMAPALGNRDDFPKGNFSLFGKYDFSSLKKYFQYSSPCIIHLENAHRIIADGKFIDKGTAEYFKAIATDSKYRIIIESREETGDILPKGIYKDWEVYGLDRESMANYFGRPFKDRPRVGWPLDDSDKEFIYSWLGGNDLKGRAHPLAMTLLASLADGKHKTPAQILKDFEERDVMVKDLESQLFTDLYEQVLSPAQQHLLRLFSMYREGIPDLHMSRLNEAVGDEKAFQRLKQRCLLTANERDDWYQLHSLISEMAHKRIIVKSLEYWQDNDIIADAWRAQLKISSHISQPNMKAAGEALYHLTEAENYEGYYELSDKLLGKDIICHLEQVSRNLVQIKKYKEDRCVLDLLVKLDRHEPKYHRFLAQTIEKLKGEGDDEALRHYREAYDLRPKYPPHLADLGRCLLARGEPKVFIETLEKLTPQQYHGVMDNHNLAIYTSCLEKVGDMEKASRLRREQIDAGTTDAAFYADEANYLLSNEKYKEALEIITKAENRKCVNEYTLAIKTRCIEAIGGEEEASRLRREQIDTGTTDTVFYADESNYLLNQKRYQEALEIIGKAEARKCADEYILAVKTKVLEESGLLDEASRLRREQIDAGSGHPAFYNDEAIYLLSQKRYPEALEIIGKAEARKCAGNHTLAIKTKILEESGEAEKASGLRREQIDAGTINPAFYADEAIYLIKKQKYDEARAIIEKAEKRGCADKYTESIKAKLPKLPPPTD